LLFVFTDAPIAAGALQSLLKSGVEDTFNAVTIDGDSLDVRYAAGLRPPGLRAGERARLKSAAPATRA